MNNDNAMLLCLMIQCHYSNGIASMFDTMSSQQRAEWQHHVERPYMAPRDLILLLDNELRGVYGRSWQKLAQREYAHEYQILRSKET